MYLTRHQTPEGPRWARNGRWLPRDFRLSLALELPRQAAVDLLAALPDGGPADGPLLPPLEPEHEVWASGVTYLRSRDARMAESTTEDVYERVYDAERPELFFKAIGWRVAGDGMPIRVRRDSGWDVPEPELTLVLTRDMDVVGYCAGDDVSSRAIEGANPLYLPQAKIYDGACALGPGIQVCPVDEMGDLPVRLAVTRTGAVAFAGETRTSAMKRPLGELAAYLGRELTFPFGALLMTGTGIVPPEDFSLRPGDVVEVTVGALTLRNPVAG